MKKNLQQIFIILLLTAFGCNTSKPTITSFDTEPQLHHFTEKVKQTLSHMDVLSGFPRSVHQGDSIWSTTAYGGWTSGFYPGILWYLFEYSGDDIFRQKAEEYTAAIEPLKFTDWKTHDFGFMMYNSAGHGYRLTGNEDYQQWLQQTADSLATLFNPSVGTLMSWPWMKQRNQWPHNTIIDNMLNLEFLFWAAEKGNKKHLYNMAVSHARTTLANHFREDFSTWHVLVYDDSSPTVLQKITNQGYSDESVWSRGQAWAIYGYTMCYRETGIPEFLDAAIKAADFFIHHLPEDYVPYWDFRLPSFEDEPRDASAGAIAASAFVELSSLVNSKQLNKKYYHAATSILNSLSQDYLSENTMAILDHSTGSKPHNSEVDVPIIYADYYYLEALLRMHRLNNK
jgi:unsaturated chondroitin disaccharide hydrolase